MAAPNTVIAAELGMVRRIRLANGAAASFIIPVQATAAAPTAHALTAVERHKLSAAFAALPPLHRRVLGERLRSVSFLDGMPNTALTCWRNVGSCVWRRTAPRCGK